MNKIDMLETKLSTAFETPKSIDNLPGKAIDNLSRLDLLYEQATVKQKRQINKFDFF